MGAISRWIFGRLQWLVDTLSYVFDRVVLVLGPLGVIFGSTIHSTPLRYAVLFLWQLIFTFLAVFPGYAIDGLTRAGLEIPTRVDVGMISQSAIACEFVLVALLALNWSYNERWRALRNEILTRFDGSRVAGIVGEPRTPEDLSDEVAFASLWLIALLVVLFGEFGSDHWDGRSLQALDILGGLQYIGFSLLSALPFVDTIFDVAPTPPDRTDPTVVGVWGTTTTIFFEVVFVASVVALFQNVAKLVREDGALKRVVHTELSPQHVIAELGGFDKTLENRLHGNGRMGPIVQLDGVVEEYRTATPQRRSELRPEILETLQEIQLTGELGGLTACVQALTVDENDLEIAAAAANAIAEIGEDQAIQALVDELQSELCVPRYASRRWKLRRALVVALSRFKRDETALGAILEVLTGDWDESVSVRRAALKAVEDLDDLPEGPNAPALIERLQNVTARVIREDPSSPARQTAVNIRNKWSWQPVHRDRFFGRDDLTPDA